MTRTLFVFLTLLIAGCYSDKPIAALEQAVFDERLLGKWSTIDDEGEFIVLVSRVGEKEYMAIPDTEDDQDEPMRFYITQVGDERFLNAREVHNGKPEGDYMFGRYTVLNNKQVLIDVPELDAIPHEVASSKALYDVFREKSGQPGFYDGNPRVYHRVVD